MLKMRWFYLLLFLFIVGQFNPQRDSSGRLLKKQCWGSTGTCWCIYGADKKPFPASVKKICPDFSG